MLVSRLFLINSFIPKYHNVHNKSGNHDAPRVASRLGTHRIDAINMILTSMPGISITYMGEELGMTNVWLSWKDTVDPEACNTNPAVYERYSRDPSRTPFQWTNQTSAGFSSNATTWLPVSPLYRIVNVQAELYGLNSHLQCYRKLMQLRKQPAMRRGRLALWAANRSVLVIAR